jgi:regulatory protein
MNSQKTYTVEEAKRAIERYCVYQERCHKETERKLKEYRMIPEAIQVIIVHLIEHNFLNEERFARSFARGKFRIKKWGKQRIIRELRFRDISQYNIKSAFKEINEEDYLNTFNALAEKKFESITESNKYKKKKKLTDYLLYRGWESSLVFEKANSLIKF